MDKQYGSAPPPGMVVPPPSYDGPGNAYPPNIYPSHPTGAYPANNYPSNNPPSNNYPSSSYPPNNYPSNSPPSNNYPSSSYPQNNYPGQSGQTTSTIVVTGGPTVPNYGPNSQQLTCPYCHHFISTKVESKATTKTHLIALILCCCLCWLCCCCPYCMDSCQGRNHYCPQCNAFLGTYVN